MLATPHKTHHLSSPRRPQNISSTSSSSPSYNPGNRNSFNISHSSTIPSPSEVSGKLPNYLDSSSSGPASSVVLDTSNIPINNIDIFMPHSLDFQSNQSNNYPFNLTDATSGLAMWQLGGGNGVANQMGAINRSGQNHQRMASSSSIGSAASAATASPFQGQQAAHVLRGQDQVSGKQNAGRGYSRNQQSTRSHLPTPTQTPTRNTFLSPTSPSFGQQGQDMSPTIAASLGLNQALDEELPQMSRSSRPSFSSMQGPATPMTAVSEGPDERQRSLNNDSMNNAMVTVSNSIPDLFYSQNMAISQAPSNPNFLMPHHGNNMMNERLMEAQMARSQSSGSNQSVPLSPMKYHMSPHTESEPKTISPKDAVLDYKPSADDFPLFGQTSANMSSSYPTVTATPTRQQQFNQASAMDFGNISGPQDWTQNLQSITSAAMPTYSAFATPSLPSSLNMGSMSGGFLGASGSHPRRTVSRQTEPSPEFPAQLTSMESSVSEAAPPSSAASSNLLLNSPKPESSADTGTYSCTYHGCLQRFSTPQKLQKHKRDVHRNNPHVTPGVGSGMSTSQLMERNSQSGPHKCDRPNPTTGKMCNAVFSRPYDLTRHEDTIHNARKQKVRCAICTEEKTFSRRDALTRHLKVVHPDVDYPGKQRKRGSRGD